MLMVRRRRRRSRGRRGMERKDLPDAGQGVGEVLLEEVGWSSHVDYFCCACD